MNARRAANRAKSARVADHDLHYTAGEEHTAMHGRRIAHREPEHHEKGYKGRHEPHASFGSPASLGASKGPGPLPGAGELINPGAGPGPAARTERAAMDVENSPVGSRTTPGGMKTYNQE